MIIGVTGSIASGKSTVSGIFAKHGCSVINVDDLYRKISVPGTALHRNIVSAFGKEILDSRKRLDRGKLKSIVFADARKLKLLNKITHPLILKETKKRIKDIEKKGKKKERNIVIDAPLLIEARFHRLCDIVVLVKLRRDVQIKRALKRKKHTENEIKQILKSQWPLYKKKSHADFVIDNSRTQKQTTQQTERLIKRLTL